jgi:hypothetical protein
VLLFERLSVIFTRATGQPATLVGACPDQCPHGCNQHLEDEEKAESPPSASGKGTDLKSWDVKSVQLTKREFE